MELPRGIRACRRAQMIDITCVSGDAHASWPGLSSSRLGVPVLTFIVRAVPVRESLRCGTCCRKGAYFVLITCSAEVFICIAFA